jgi:hypothetical protein
MTAMRGWDLSDADIALLRRCADGHTHRPSDAADGDFEATVARLTRLRGLGLIRLDEGRIMRGQGGRCLMAGPCDITAEGRRLLEEDDRLGVRP